MQNIIDVCNPFDFSKVGDIKLVTADSIETFLAKAHQISREKGKQIPKHERILILRRTAGLMKNIHEELALLIAAEGGKPLIDARVEVTRAIDGVETCANDLGNVIGKEIPMGLTEAAKNRIAFSIREPIGPVVAVSAFNHPLNLIVHQVAPAIAVGCPCIVKPANDTPLSCQKFVSLLIEAGLPKNWIGFAPCENNVAEKLVTDKRVAFFSFIGSAKVGWYLKSKLAPGTRCALEHGGAAPVIVCESADTTEMIPKLIKGGFYHSGQVCVSVQRIFVLGGKGKKVAENIASGASKLKVGNAIEEQTECGPLIRPGEVQRVEQWVNEAIAENCEVICGGHKLSETTYSPTVLLNPDENSKVSTAEIFGPVVCVYDCADIHEAVRRANSLDVAFQASIFSNNLSETISTFSNLDATAVMINGHTAFRVDWMPFAGRKQSGHGIGGIGYTMEDMTQIKMAVINS
jgi:acyl-CoA reductase-like NAD-dependent aldehyde dehydrogenase